jgi:carbon monoxide dehydrogenase subunit G
VSSTWKLIDADNGKTKLEITVELKTGGFIGSIFKGALKRKMTKLYDETAEEFKYYVENEQPHPRKIKAIGKT